MTHTTPAHQFIAYRQRGGGASVHLGTSSAGSLDEALAELTQSGLDYKDILIVHERHDGRGVNIQHAYRIRQGAAVWMRNPQTGLSERVKPLKPDHLFSLPVYAFHPKLMFDAFRDDAVGVERGLIEGSGK